MEEQCPEVNKDGIPCQKRFALGKDYHGGGHMFATNEIWEALTTHHYNAKALLSGETVITHTEEDCPGPPECYQEKN